MNKALLAVATGLALAAGSSNAFAAQVIENENNNTLATAQNIDNAFSLDFSTDIGDASTNTSTSIPHVSCRSRSRITPSPAPCPQPGPC